MGGASRSRTHQDNASNFPGNMGCMGTWWHSLETWIHEHPLIWSAGLIAATLLLSASIYGMAAQRLKRWTQRTDSSVDDAVVRHLRGPLRWLIPVASLRLMAPLITLPDAVRGPVRHAMLVVLIGLVAWLLERILHVIEDVVAARLEVEGKGNLQARSLYTQVRGFRNIAAFLIGLLAVAFMLMTFDQVREVGVSLLASAGIAGMVIGFAAQRSIATVIAGIQVALAQPIRVNDVVIVEGEWGWIEEITLTFVVVRVWDLRRLVVPISHFIEKPFQNWSRVSPELLGTVHLHTDYTIPVDEVRAALERILDATDLWDGKVRGLQVTGAGERTLELRALMSAADAGKIWELRCHVREALIGFIQQTYPQSLPRHRAELDSGPSEQPSAAEQAAQADRSKPTG